VEKLVEIGRRWRFVPRQSAVSSGLHHRGARTWRSQCALHGRWERDIIQSARRPGNHTAHPCDSVPSVVVIACCNSVNSVVFGGCDSVNSVVALARRIPDPVDGDTRKLCQ